MKCPTCEDTGQRSTVRGGGRIVTAMMSDSYWDEDGRYHRHDPNTSTASYRCSLGHEWTLHFTPGCPACGIPDELREVRS